MEPRMRMRQKGQQFPSSDLEAYLFAFGDDRHPLPETVKVLDETITDFIIETSHAAALHASYSRRTKIKVDDFKFAIRKDPKKLGRVVELLNKEKLMKAARQGFDFNEGKLRKEALKEDKDKEKEKEVAKEKEPEKRSKKRKEGTDGEDWRSLKG